MYKCIFFFKMTEEKFEDYIYINKFFLRFIGLWPNGENNTAWRKFIYKFRLFLFPSLLWSLLFLPMLLDVYVVWGNNYAIFQNLCMTVHAFCICLKFTHIAANQTALKVLLHNIHFFKTILYFGKISTIMTFS